MKLAEKKWIKFKNEGITVKKSPDGLVLENPTERHGFALLPRIFSKRSDKFVSVKFNGNVISGDAPVLEILNRRRTILAQISFNSQSVIPIDKLKYFIFSIKIPENCKAVITKIDIEFSNESNQYESLINSGNDILIITPSYPTEENKYFGGFVHSRAKAYKDAGVKFDLVCSHYGTNDCSYSFESVDVNRMSLASLRQLLQNRKYKTILLHFFDSVYSNILDAVDLSETQLFFWVHGPETLYWDWPEMTDLYFTQKSSLTEAQLELFKKNDALINRYNDMPNVHWVFVSNWIKNHSEELIDIKFKQYFVIPNFIDEKNFAYTEKSPESRFNIFFLRRFENINKYAIDVAVRTILELSRRDIFNKLTFNIYGTGQFYNELIEPIKNFPNVKLSRHFMTHEDIAKAHKENGIGLFATRYDAQGVSMCEAAMSGLVIVSSTNDAIAEFIPCEKEDGLLCDTENYVAYADEIERICNDEKLFSELSKKCHDKVYDLCRFEKTIAKEIEFIRNISEFKKEINVLSPSEKILSIIIPSYNVSKYLKHGVDTILNHKNASKLEVIIVNDGSKDNTVEVAKKLEEEYGNSAVVIIDKENGGHGSTINEGLKKATGKYVRIIDGDDWVNSAEFEKLIDILEKEDSDIVVTDYSEDIAFDDIVIRRNLYQYMSPGVKYKFDDLCFENYGFNQWGPILATGNFKTEVLRKTGFKLSEKSFYIDMEFDAYSIIDADTVSYYPLDIYRYFIGRAGQSISEESYKRNYSQHENVIFNLIKISKTPGLSAQKQKYITDKLIFPMLVANYTILLNYIQNPKLYYSFEKKLMKYPELYNSPKILTTAKKIHRLTHGLTLRPISFFKKIL